MNASSPILSNVLYPPVTSLHIPRHVQSCSSSACVGSRFLQFPLKLMFYMFGYRAWQRASFLYQEAPTGTAQIWNMGQANADRSKSWR